MRAAVAVRVDRDDPLSTLELKDGWPTPECGPNQVRVRLAATTVNMHDSLGTSRRRRTEGLVPQDPRLRHRGVERPRR